MEYLEGDMVLFSCTSVIGGDWVPWVSVEGPRSLWSAGQTPGIVYYLVRSI